MRKYLITVFLCCLINTVFGAGDKSIALVGNRIIWNNDVVERAQARSISYVESLSQLIEENLLIVQARKDNIQVAEEEVEARFNFILDQWQKKGIDFLKFIKDNGLTVEQYKEIIKDQIRVEKLVAKIQSDISVSPFEVVKKMAEIPQQQVLLLKKSFDSASSAETFIAKLKEKNEMLTEMETTGWVETSRIDPSVLSQIQNVGQGKPAIIKSDEKFTVYVLAGIRNNSPEERYRMAYSELYQQKANKKYSEYINQLSKTIPVRIFDQDIAKKLSVFSEQ
ncbi:MAG: hypothetical protein ACP5JO_02525 [Candidatus Ratteibacteria bacterium]